MIPTEYDTFAYKTTAFPKAHANRLAVIAQLAGLEVPTLATARILELGCGDGTHLAWMAATLPRAQCVGVDLSRTAVDKGLQAITRKGLSNATLQAVDVMQIDVRFGQFDYIISHGLYSWVPDPVREQILRICRTNLSPNGVAYISFNTKPENAFRDIAREIMRVGASDATSPEEKIARGRAALKAVTESARSDELYRSVMQSQLERVTEAADYLLYHDDFAPFQKSFYFHEFATALQSQGLQFLGDAELGDSAIAAALTQSSVTSDGFATTRLEREQWLDFSVGRAFRSALLVHAGRTVSEEVRDTDVPKFRISGDARFTVANDMMLASRTKVHFKGISGSAMNTDEPLVKCALALVSRRAPASYEFAELFSEVLMMTALADTDATRANLRETLVRGVALGMIELHCEPELFTLTLGERPCMHPFTRVAIADTGTGLALTGKPVNAEDPPIRHFASLLDGTRDRAALSAEMRAFLQANHLPVPEDDMLARIMENGLNLFAKSGAMIA